MAQRLVGTDSNIFSIIAQTKKILSKLGHAVTRRYEDEITAMMKGGKNYEEILGFSGRLLNDLEAQIKIVERQDALEDETQTEVTCENCNQKVAVEDAELVRGTWYCKRCHEDADECSGCGKPIFHPNEGNSKGNGEWWCDRCWSKRGLDNSDEDDD